ncbi:type II toxin-antitoxin system VapC family toxin [Hymenobacter arizonensis]|uniref:PIN domain-containing protein n=1 Tax=Hymenobacter arizonensis TaxID=1227077 RepID=A0A1I5V2M7_HYMAR|nr:PIN domain-containing protein [Hymenobacter arizonensis]SFQ01749.1 PIN domain-containing protein [Hymenobacter arizonensis]
MKKYLLDTNVLIDYLARREPFGADAAELMQAGATGEARFYVASLSFANIEYIMRRQTSATQARQLLLRLEQLVEILPVDASVIRQALASNFGDFEDGIQHFVALAHPPITAIITRDPKGFRDSALPVFSVAQALTELDAPAS